LYVIIIDLLAHTMFISVFTNCVLNVFIQFPYRKITEDFTDKQSVIINRRLWICLVIIKLSCWKCQRIILIKK